nr:HNH endonuclease signature motif containing protein [Mammaliicoccus sciuri]
MLRDDGLCQYCLAEGMIHKAEVIDHFIPIKDDFSKKLDADNLVASCIRHNTLKEIDEKKLRNNEITIEEYKNKWRFGNELP